MSTIAVGSHAHDDAHGHGGHDAHAMSFISKYVFSKDHKIIGIQFLFTTLLWFLVGGVLALGVRWQLAWPWSRHAGHRQDAVLGAKGDRSRPSSTPMLFTMHATVMIFFVIIPILAGAFGNFLIPLMIGADDMAFPTLNMLSYWFMWPAFIAIGGSFFVDGGAAKSRLDLLSAAVVHDGPRLRGQTLWLIGPDVRRRVVDDGLDQLHDHHHPDARSGHDHVPPADDDLGHVHHRHPAGVRLARADGGRLHAADRPRAGHRLLHSRRHGRPITPHPLPAADSRCCGSTCSGSIRIRPCTS